MGEAADDLWDRVMDAESERMMFLKNLRKTCGDSCHIVSADYDENDDDWLPLLCVTCKERFDYP